MRVRPPLLPTPTAIPGSPTNTSQAVRPHANSNSVSGTSYPQVYGTERTVNAHASFGYSIRSEEHTSELQSRFDLVCRLLLEKKKIPASPILTVLLSVAST